MDWQEALRHVSMLALLPFALVLEVVIAHQKRQWNKAQMVDKHGKPVHPRLAKRYEGKSQPRSWNEK